MLKNKKNKRLGRTGLKIGDTLRFEYGDGKLSVIFRGNSQNVELVPESHWGEPAMILVDYEPSRKGANDFALLICQITGLSVTPYLTGEDFVAYELVKGENSIFIE